MIHPHSQRARRLSALAIALLAGSAWHVPAAAQTSVTVFGIADAAARHVSNQGRGSIDSLVSGSNSTSRLGFRGSEDLGGGLTAGFHLEHGLLLDVGSPVQAAQFWDRRATISLASRTLGELRLGRDFVPSYVNWSRYDPFSYVGVAGANNLISAAPLGPIRSAFGSGANTTVRSSNAIQYLLPANLGGVEGGLMVAAGEGGTAATGAHKVRAGRLGYAGGGWGVSAAQTRSDNDMTVAGSLKDSVVAGNAAAWGVKLSAAYRVFQYAQARQDNLLLAAAVPVGGAGEIKLSAQRANAKGRVGSVAIDANDATQIGLGYVHSLSKRTVLYAHHARIGNDGAATFVVPGGPAGLSGGGRSTGTEAGVRHTF